MSIASIMRDQPDILFETYSWLALDKPAGWHSVEQRGAEKDASPTVEGWLREQFDWARGLPEGGLVHRLDQPTCGVLVAAKSAAAQERLRRAFQTGEGVEKRYLAVVEPGIASSGEFTLFFTSRYRRSKKVTVSDEGDAKHAGRCRWRVRNRGTAGDLIEVELIGPGRRHQIRAGLAHLGHPIKGDALYGGEPWRQVDSIALQACRLTLNGTTIDAPTPDWAGG